MCAPGGQNSWAVGRIRISGLDQSVRGRIIALLRHIQADSGVAYLFISHDLDTVRRLAIRWR